MAPNLSSLSHGVRVCSLYNVYINLFLCICTGGDGKPLYSLILYGIYPTIELYMVNAYAYIYQIILNLFRVVTRYVIVFYN